MKSFKRSNDDCNTQFKVLLAFRRDASPKGALGWEHMALRLGTIAEGRGLPRAQVALAWLLQKPAVTAPIVGATKPQHLEDAVGALAVKLSHEEIKALEELYVPHPLVGFE